MEVLGFGLRQLDESGNRVGCMVPRLIHPAVSPETWKSLLPQELQMFSDLTENLDALLKVVPNIPESLEVIAVCVEDFDQYWPLAIDDRENTEPFEKTAIYEPHTRVPQFSQGSWEFLGFDVANAWLDMLELECYYVHPLFPESATAHLFCDKLNLDPDLDGPFYVYGLYSVCKVLREDR